MAGTATAGIAAFSPSSYGSVVVNGQLVGTQTKAAYSPTNYGGGISAVPSASPITIPPSVGYGASSVSGGGGGGAVGSTGTPNGTQRGSYTGGFAGSPGMWAIILLGIAFMYGRHVAWHKDKKED